MKCKLAVVLAVVCFIEAIQSVPLQDISPITKQKVAEAIAEAKEVKRETEHRVELIRDAISRRGKVAYREISERKDVIKQQREQAKIDAHRVGVKIEDCTDAEKHVVEQVDDDEVVACKKTEETRQALDIVDEIDYQIHRLKEASDNCHAYVDRNACVLKTVGDVKSKVSGLKEKIGSVLDNYSDKSADQCIATEIKKLQSKLTKAVKDFKACVKARMPSFTDNVVA